MAETQRGSVQMWTAPDLQGLARAACSDRLRSYVRLFSGLATTGQDGLRGSEVQTRERHFLPANRAEYLTSPARAERTTSSYPASSGLSVRPAGLTPSSAFPSRLCQRRHRYGATRRPVPFAADHQFPSDPRQLVCQCYHHQLRRLARDQVFQPGPRATASSHIRDFSRRASHQNGSQHAVTGECDDTETVLASR